MNTAPASLPRYTSSEYSYAINQLFVKEKKSVRNVYGKRKPTMQLIASKTMQAGWVFLYLRSVPAKNHQAMPKSPERVTQSD